MAYIICGGVGGFLSYVYSVHIMAYVICGEWGVFFQMFTTAFSSSAVMGHDAELSHCLDGGVAFLPPACLETAV